MRTAKLLGFRIDLGAESEVVGAVGQALEAQQGGWLFTVNVDILRRIARDDAFRQMVDVATIRVLDGMPLVWATHIAAGTPTERVPGADLVWSLSKMAAEHGRTVFFLGGNPGTADATAKALAGAYPGLRVAGTEALSVQFENDGSQIRRAQEAIWSCRPDIVFVALGSPKQDRLIAAIRPLFPRTWFVGVGIAFSFVAGDMRRAPRIWQRAGLEWLYRLGQEPRRLAARYLRDDLGFTIVLLWRSVVSRLDRPQSETSTSHAEFRVHAGSTAHREHSELREEA